MTAPMTMNSGMPNTTAARPALKPGPSKSTYPFHLSVMTWMAATGMKNASPEMDQYLRDFIPNHTIFGG